MNPLVYIVDDDQAMVESLSWIIESVGLDVKGYTNAQKFLNEYNPAQHSCALIDVRMSTMSGTELQLKINNLSNNLPIIFISGHADIPLAVRAMKAGAIDFLTKPFNDHILLESINKAIQIDKCNREKKNKFISNKEKLSLLSPREMQVLNAIIDGKQNKMISTDLNISLKTVEAHRASMMKKIGVKSVAELVKMIFTNEIET